MKKNNPKIYIVFIILSIVCFTLFFIFNEQKTTYELFLLGEKELTLYRNEEYIEPGYIIKDSNGNSINIEIITESNLDITKEGIYEIKYKYNGKVLSERKIKD